MSSQFNIPSSAAATLERQQQQQQFASSSSTSSSPAPTTTTAVNNESNTSGSYSSFHNKPQVSNLTKNLLSSSMSQSGSITSDSNSIHHIPSNPPSYTNSFNSRNKIIPNDYDQMGSYRTSASVINNSFQHTNPGDSSIYIPSSHNTPNVISTSYSSNHSHNPADGSSLPQSQTLGSVSNTGFIPQRFNQPSSYKTPTGIIPNAIPTTNVFTDSAAITSTSVDSYSSSFSHHSSFTFPHHQPPITGGGGAIPPQPPMQPNSLQHNSRIPINITPSSSGTGSNLMHNSQQQAQSQPTQYLQPFTNTYPQSIITDRSVPGSGTSTMTSTPVHSIAIPQRNQQLQEEEAEPRVHSASSLSSQLAPPQQKQEPYVPPEPDHYMTYSEFLQNLTNQDQSGTSVSSSGNVYEEHLNIVDYPVNDLIVMLSCLLSKIIEANDKLHPNHFENTIAIRQRLKEEKRVKKLQREKRQVDNDGDIDINRETSSIKTNDNEQTNEEAMDFENDNNDEEEEDDDDEDEMKNKYLANVLAFHGTNVPGISLHAYLARVLKYCPVTNEVFLSLLVYFDRIAKKANNLNQRKKSMNGHEDEQQQPVPESEQLFVMDSYSIHRLIISGITVSSKFFSDIFYKNLRYAKVGGLPLEELNYLELQFLLLLDFKLMISVEDLQNYGDLLLRFWKREQITNELVHNPEGKHEIRSN
ncbi:PHO85 cyclin-7 [Spathaspora sp. JA1]|nr:PHO85 cyclin-7 [Spathaspora sp. JA1]